MEWPHGLEIPLLGVHPTQKDTGSPCPRQRGHDGQGTEAAKCPPRVTGSRRQHGWTERAPGCMRSVRQRKADTVLSPMCET